MNVPNFVNDQFVDKDGRLADNWSQILTQLFSQMQDNLSDEGFKVPQQPTSTITQLSTAPTNGTLIYDNDTHQLKVVIDGVFKNVTVT